MTDRIGVLVCDCKGQVSDHVDTARVAEAASALEGVALVERHGLLCGGTDLGAAIRRVKAEIPTYAFLYRSGGGELWRATIQQIEIDPANKALAVHDLKKGDIVYAVNGVESDALTSNFEAYMKLTAVAGEKLRLELIRDGERIEMEVATYRESFRKQEL